MPELVERIRSNLPALALAAAGSCEGAAALLGVKKTSFERDLRRKKAG